LRVAYTEVPPTRRNDETYRGVLIHIRPPVQLNPTAVGRFLIYGDLEPVETADRDLDVKDVVLLGSTHEQTTIYASIDKDSSESLVKQVANDTVRLLGFMGAHAIIDNPPTPEA